MIASANAGQGWLVVEEEQDIWFARIKEYSAYILHCGCDFSTY